MHARFHAPDARAAGDLVALSAEDVEHLSRVLRLGTGAAVRIFDGRGREFHGIIEGLTRSGARVRVGSPVIPASELPVALTLAQAVLKGDKMDDVIRDAVMLGVGTIQPIVTSRTDVPAAALERGRRRQRWERIVMASVKQCGRAVVPSVEEPRAFGDLMDGSRDPQAPVLMLVEPSAASGAVALRDLEMAPPPSATIVIGPEGGWAPHEVEAGAAMGQLITLGAITLRADATPAIALAALLSHWKVL